MKALKTPYSFVVLRYMHDVFTREFVNVGVLLHAPHVGFLAFEKLSALDRVKGMFPGLQSDSLRDLLTFLALRTAEVHNSTSGQLFDRGQLSAETIAKSLLPTDDSALQWSGAGGGATDDPQKSLGELFERLVERHLKAHPPTRKEDVDVWKSFEREFRRRDVLQRFQEKTLTVGKLKHRFEAWQPAGGYLRLFQPLSFDLIDPSKIVEKAIHWNGLLRQFRKADSDFYAYLLIGAPSDNDRKEAFKQACDTLAEDGNQKELVREEEAPKFAAGIEKEIKAIAND
jgi:hypothetical protein